MRAEGVKDVREVRMESRTPRKSYPYEIIKPAPTTPSVSFWDPSGGRTSGSPGLMLPSTQGCTPPPQSDGIHNPSLPAPQPDSWMPSEVHLKPQKNEPAPPILSQDPQGGAASRKKGERKRETKWFLNIFLLCSHSGRRGRGATGAGRGDRGGLIGSVTAQCPHWGKINDEN